MPAKAFPLSPNPATASQQINTLVDGVAVSPTALFGWSATETTGTTGAKFRLRDGTSASSPLLTSTITLTGGESDREWFGDQTVEIFNGGVFFEVVSGSVEAVIWAG